MITGRSAAAGARVGGATVALLLLWGAGAKVGPRGLPVGVLALGVILGVTTALAAVGIVVVYRGTGVLNLAHGQLGAVGTTTALALRTHAHLPWLVAVAVGLAVAGVAGGATHLTVVRRLRQASTTVAVVATVGVAQLLHASARALAMAMPARHAPSVLGPLHLRITLDPIVLSGDHLLAGTVATAVVIALVVASERARLGLALRAIATNLPRAATLGLPVDRVLATAWAAAAGLAALALALQAPIVGLTVTSAAAAGGTALLLRAIAAAVVGGMTDLRRTVVAAVALGVFEEAVTWWTGDGTIASVAIAGVILLAVAIAPFRRSGAAAPPPSSPTWTGQRASMVISPPPAGWMPRARTTHVASLVVLLAATVGLPVLAPPHVVHAVSSVWPYAILAISVVVITGWTGHLTLGQSALAAVGGGVCLLSYSRHHADVFLALALAGAAGAAVALLVGLPARRQAGPFLPVATLALAVACSEWLVQARHAPWFVVTAARPPKLWGLLATNGETATYYFGLAVLAVTFIAAARVARSPVRRAALAVAENARAAIASGVVPAWAETRAFAIGGAVAGVGGGLLALHQHGLHPEAYTPEASMLVVAMATIGGLGSVRGALIGALYVEGALRVLPSTWAELAIAAAIIAFVVWSPSGLAGLPGRVWAAIATRNERSTSRPAPAAAASTDVTLAIRDLHLRFDGVPVLRDIDCRVGPGEIVAVLGPNGAGKSSLADCITGVLRPSRGTVWYSAADITDLPAHLRRRRGIAFAPAGRGVFADLSVAENLAIAGWATGAGQASGGDVLPLFPELALRMDERAAALSGGEQQLLNLAMALTGRPRLLVLDELTEGLAPSVVERVLDVVRRVRSEGIAVVLIEQAPSTAARVAERAVFIEAGEVRFDGPMAELGATGLARPFLLGGAGRRREPAPATGAAAAGAVLEVTNVSVEFGAVRALDNVSLSVGTADVVGVVGPNGAGKSTLFDVISGFVAPSVGRVRLGAEDVTSWSPQARHAAGLGRSFQDAHLWPSLSVRDAVSLALDRAGTEAHHPEEAIGAFQLEKHERRPISSLSPGTRRLVELAVAVAARPAVVLLDEPSEGVGAAELEPLASIIGGLVGEWTQAVVLIEHNLDLVRAVATRRVVLARGRVEIDRAMHVRPG